MKNDDIGKLFIIATLIIVAIFGERLLADAFRQVGFASIGAEILSGSFSTFAFFKSLKLVD